MKEEFNPTPLVLSLLGCVSLRFVEQTEDTEMKTKMRHEGLALPILVALTLTVALAANGAKANAQEALFIAHYAEVDPAGKTLLDVGRKRVEALTRLIMDAGIDVIYSSKAPVGRRTAEPIEKALNIKSNLFSPRLEVIDDIIRRLRIEHMGHRVLIVTGNWIRDHIAKAYGVKDFWKLRSDNLIVIVPRGREKPLLIRMRW